MSRRQRIEDQLGETIAGAHVEVVDESHGHNVPRGAESHFNVLVVSDAFADMSRVERHRLVHGALSAEFAGGMHALTMTLRTPEEHGTGRGAMASPACLGGSKADRG